MPGFQKRICPACGVEKTYRADHKTCGCAGTGWKEKPGFVQPRTEPQPGETPVELREINEMTGDAWKITLPKTRIHTLEELVAFFKVDMGQWEVERFIANKWEKGYKDAASAPGHYELYQVKAFFRKKRLPLDHYAKDNALLTRRLAKTRLDLDAQRSYNKHLAQNHAGYDDLLANLKDFVGALGDVALPKFEIFSHVPLCQAPIRFGHSEDAVLLLSDEHFGDVIRRADTSGFPEFNLPISGNRFGYVIKKAKQVLSIHRAMYPIKKLYVWLGGDTGNGVLHDAAASNALFIAPQIHFSYHMIRLGLEDLLTLTVPDPVTGVVVVEEIVLLASVGNHMRQDEHMPHKYQAQRTFDWLIYQFLFEHFRSKPNITIHADMSPFIFENIRGHKYMFTHGYQVGYKNNPEKQAESMGKFIMLVRALFDSPEFRKKNGLMGSTFDHVCIGDIHIPVDFPRLTSNGSLNGQNELGVNWTLEPIPAGQQLFGVS